MNLSLLDPFVLAQDCPETVTSSIRSGHSTAIRFSHRGDFLASGRLDGNVVVFDVETNGVARKLKGHVRQVQSLSWSADDRYLLSAAHDWKVILWDLQDGSKIRSLRFESPVFIAELHPKNHLQFLIALFEDQPAIVDFTEKSAVKRLMSSAPLRTQLERDNPTDKQTAQDAKQATIYAQFTPSGDHIIAATNKGWMNIIDAHTCQTLHSTRLTANIIFLLRLTSSGRVLLTNSSDRIIRTVLLPDLTDPNLDFENLHLEAEHKYQDLVNRLSWNYATFSSSGEYVAASTYMNHDVYVWERTHGSLVKILEGPKEELSALEWHPHKPFVAATGVETGRIYFWSILTPQRWSALAPDFVEVEENVEYVEREDEFDIHPLEEIHKRRLDREDEDVDVLTVEPVKGAEWAHPALFRMPVLLDNENDESEDEVVAIGTGQYRRKTPGQDLEPDGLDAGLDGVGRLQNGGGGGNKRRRNE